MKTDILVVGAGHGGLLAGARLAQDGFKVTILEKAQRNSLSWNWKDCLDRNVFQRINFAEPEESAYEIPANFRFYAPNQKHYLETDIPPEEREIYMERRLLAEKLVRYALNSGAEIRFAHNVTGPLIEDDRISGVRAGEENFYADLIIDSAGFHTPIRPHLPPRYLIPAKLKEGEYFYAYRGFFNLQDQDKFWDIIIGFNNKRGISWIHTSPNEADVLMGAVNPLEKDEISMMLKELRTKYPIIGEQLLRGGQVEIIPIRRPLEKLVGDNYAVIGDAACMTNPVNGSGIIRSLIAGDILARTVIENRGGPFTTSNLWRYQVEYNNEIGAAQGYIEVIKNFLVSVDDFSKIDFLFANNILASRDIETGIRGRELKISLGDMISRGIRGLKRVDILMELANSLSKAKKVKKHYLQTPSHYQENSFLKWQEKLEKILA